MLKNLRIQQFKGWKDTATINMAPISLFFGTNSSGKSSIGQFLMMLKQTVESPDRKAVFFPGGSNSAVQLGSYNEMVHGRDATTNIEFEYQWDLPLKLEIRDPVSKKSYLADTISFKANIGLDKEKRLTTTVNDFNYLLKQDNEDILEVGMARKADKKSDYEVRATSYELKREKGSAWPPNPPLRFYGFPDVVIAYYQNIDFVQDINLAHEELFKRIFYLGPLRTKADRLYSWAGTEPEGVGYAGENTVAAILASRDRKISLGHKQKTRSLEEIVAQKLKQMGLIDDFRVNQISEKRQEYEVNVKTKGSNEWVDLPDVGFGLSQVLPVLVQCIYAPHNSIIIMEQPEIHLHPSAQSILADVMIEIIKSKEDGKDRNIQLVIETHSEHFLRRLQRRIAEDEIQEGKVAAYFASVARRPATLEPLKIDEYGNVLNWPENFFGDEMEDVAGQAKAALKKRKEKK